MAVEAVTGWRPAAGGVQLLDEGGRVRLVLARADEMGLPGSWLAVRYVRANGELIEPLADFPIRITFDADGSLSGTSGCRLLEGRFTSERDQVVLAPVDVVGLPCEGDVRSQERRLLRIFEQVIFWQRDGFGLVLADGDGTPLLELRRMDEPVSAPASPLPAEVGG